MPTVVDTKIEPKEESVLKLHQTVAAQSAVQARAAGEHMLKYSPSRYAKYLKGVDLASKYKVGVTPTPQPTQPTLPTQLGPFNSGTITFDNGVPVGGWMTLALFEAGTYSLTGHFHDSAFPAMTPSCLGHRQFQRQSLHLRGQRLNVRHSRQRFP